MNRLLTYSIVIFTLLLLASCASGGSGSRHDDEIRRTLRQHAGDSFRLYPDWRMGIAAEVRSGSALFFRFSWPVQADTPRTIRELHLVDPQGAQFSVEYMTRMFNGRDKSLCVVALKPEQTYYLAAGTYAVAVEGIFSDGKEFKTNSVEFRLKERDAMLGNGDQLNERERFAAYLLFSGDDESYRAVVPLLVENLKANNAAGSHQILTRLLQQYHGARSVTETGERRDVLSDVYLLSTDSTLTTRERELSILALEEMYIRGQAQAK